MMSCITNAFEIQILLIKLKEYKYIFLTENVDKLLLHEKYDYAIKIITELLYNLLYNLLNMKLTTLRQYLNDVLAKE